MSPLLKRLVPVVLLLLLAPFAPADEEAAQEPPPDQAPPRLVLLEDQLLETPGGYPAFCAEHAKADRGSLRKDVVKALQDLANKTQPAVRKLVGDPEGTHSLWILNALVVPLTDRQAERALASPLVREIAPAGLVTRGATKIPTPRDWRRPKSEPTFRVGKRKIPWNLEGLDVPRVWKEGKRTGKGVVVAMFDSGINVEHEDLAPAMWTNPAEKLDGKDNDGNGLIDDWHGWHFPGGGGDIRDRQRMRHGSITASLVAGRGTGGTITGVAPRAKLMSLVGFGGIHNAARCFEYAIEKGADVCSMSFSIPDLGERRGIWRRMAEHASAAGLILVSGAGNFGVQQEPPVEIRIPEGIPCVICVGGVTRERVVPAFVSKGPVEWGSVPSYGDYPLPTGLIKPDVCAFPGPGIGLVRGGQKSGYLPPENRRRGNSLSAPHVAGIIALLLEERPTLTAWALKELLEQSARDLGPPGKDNQSGAGLVSAWRALEHLRGRAGPVTTPR